jgi:hypothetical protein
MDKSNSMEPKILVFIGHALYEPWSSILYQGQLKTWAGTAANPIVHVFANPVNKSIKFLDSFLWKIKWNGSFGKIFTGLEAILKYPFSVSQGNLIKQKLPNSDETALRLNMPDLDLLMNFKAFGLITGSLKYDYDFLICTTTSSYLNLDNLKKAINELPRNGLIAGRILEQGSLKFASGSFRIFSRDVVAEFLTQRNKFSTWRPEDQAFGYLVKESTIEVQYVELSSLDVPSLELLEEIPTKVLSEVIHFRLKSGTFERRDDISIMHALHQRLNRHIG